MPERLARHRGLAAQVAAAQTNGRLLGRGPARAYTRVPWGPGLALVGDAAMQSGSLERPRHRHGG
jgi:hypothetical protein